MSEGGSVPASGFDASTWDTGRSFIGRLGGGRRMTPQSPNEALQPEAPPPPPPRPPSKRRPTLSAISGFISFLAIVGLGALMTYVWVQNKLAAPGPLAEDKVVVVSSSETRSTAEQLFAEGVIDNTFVMNLVLFLERKHGRVRAGEYLFRQHASLETVIEELVSGKEVLHPITIPEGLTTAQIVARLRDNDVLVGEIRQIPKEGALLPETYKVARGTTRAKLLGIMQEDDRHVVDQIWARRSPDLPLRSPYELVTLASIVEKETGKADERPRVAGVFINRLRKHMRLQSDPTIVYGLVGGQGTLGHSIMRSELDKKTPYNTYQVDGLPPGPIDNPGRAALEAVANPSRTTDLYFVADGSGGHAFADTVEQHNRNVQHWRQIEKDAKDKQGADKQDVDKLAPSALTPPGAKPNQRSDASDDAFGGLPKAIVAVNSALPSFYPKLLDPSVSHDIAAVAANEERLPPPGRRGRKGRAAAPASMDTASLTATLDTTALSFQDMAPTVARGAALLDGPTTPADADGGASDAMPATSGAPASAVPSAASAAAPATPPTQMAKASALDATNADAKASAKGKPPVDLFADPDPDPSPEAAVPTRMPPLHPRIYDASENTALDPLRNKSYDLNTAKTIPADLAH